MRWATVTVLLAMIVVEMPKLSSQMSHGISSRRFRLCLFSPSMQVGSSAFVKNGNLRVSQRHVLHQGLLSQPPQDDPKVFSKRSRPATLLCASSSPPSSGAAKYQCKLCNCEFKRIKNYHMHLDGRQHRANVDAADATWERYLSRPGGIMARVGNEVEKENVVQAWSSRELDDLPMRATCLSPSTMLCDLTEQQQCRVWKYVSEVMPYSEFLPAIVFGMAAAYPQYLRVKELFESLETFRLMEGFLVGARKLRSVDTVYDAGCGHGLTGIMIAYRFPLVQVIGVDVVARPALTAWIETVKKYGEKLETWDAPIQNYRFVKGSVGEIGEKGHPELSRLDEACCSVAVHGCNTVTLDVIQSAITNGAIWACMPCCLPSDVYLPGCSLGLPDQGVAGGGGSGGGEERYAFLCGAISSRFSAQQVVRIDRRITNRNILIAGGVSELGAGDRLDGLNRRRIKVLGNSSSRGVDLLQGGVDLLQGE